MVELPWDDAKTRFEELAREFDEFTLTLDPDAKGALADAMEERVKAVNEFTSAVGMAIMDRPAATAAEQHRADEQLRDAPKPAEVRRAEAEARFMVMRAEQSIIPPVQAAAFAQRAQELRARREEALSDHTDASSVNAPNFVAVPPPLPQVANESRGVPTYGTGAPGTGTAAAPSNGSPASTAHGTGSASPLPSSTSPTGSLSSDPLSASDVGTETSADGLGGVGAGGVQQPMMQPMQGQPQAGAAGTAAPNPYGQQPGMLGGPGYTSPSAADAMRRNRNRKGDRDRDIATGLTGAAGFAAGAAGAAGAAAVDRGISVQGVTTKADTSGLGTQLSSANGKPPAGGAGGPVGGRMGGMMGPMMAGGLGSGSTGTSKERPDIKPGVRDSELHGLDPLRDAIPGGVVSRDTAEPEDETGTSNYFDIEEWKRKNGKE